MRRFIQTGHKSVSYIDEMGIEHVSLIPRGHYVGPGKTSCVVQNQRVKDDLLRQLERRRNGRWAWPFKETFRNL